MPNVNCLQYATRGDGVTDVPLAVWTSAGWNDYLAQPVNGQTGTNWATLALTVRKLNLASSGWKVPAGHGGALLSGATIRTHGRDLVRLLSGNAALNFTKRSATAGAIPQANGVIVVGSYNNNGGVHYFARVLGAWMGVPSGADLIARSVATAGNSNFTQTTLTGTHSGIIQGWFS